MSDDARAEPPESESSDPDDEITPDEATFEEIDKDEQKRRWTATYARLLPALAEALKVMTDVTSTNKVVADHADRVARAIGRIADTLARD